VIKLAKELYTEIEINTSADKVWKILSDFDSYSKWNPFIRQINGKMRQGEKLKILLKEPKGKETGINPTVMKVEPNHEFRWLGKIPGFHGEHIFEIKSKGKNRIRFVQRERFTGFLVPLLWNRINSSIKPAFEDMNRELKRKAEAA
jgi:hypothetical protein